MNNTLRSLRETARDMMARLSPRQRQYALLSAIVLGGIALLWLVFALQENAAGPTAAIRCPLPG